jgi:2-dehydropantoate 2-reductase
MRVCVVGAGVIGTIYGSVISQAGHDVVHVVRPGRGSCVRDGVRVNLLDARGGGVVETRTQYRPPVVDGIAGAGAELVLASVLHYQVPALLPELESGAGDAEILFFNNLWTSFEPVDAHLAGRYLWGFPVAGGGFEGGTLEAALLGDVHLGAPPGTEQERIDRVAAVFADCGLGVQLEPDILAWLWVHFAIEAGVVGAAIKAGGVDAFLSDVDAIAEAVLAVRDALAVVAARGVDPGSVPDAQMFFGPEREVAEGIRDLYAVDRAARKIMERHTGGTELRRIYADVLETGRDLGVFLPTLAPLEPYVAAFADGA